MRQIAMIAAAAMAAAGASAESVKFLGTGYGTSFRVVANNADARAALGGSSSRNVFGGIMRWDLSSLGYSSTMELVCTELSQYVSTGATYSNYTEVDLTSAPNPTVPFRVSAESAAAIARLFEHGKSLVTSNWAGAAFQAAVWEAFYDGLPGMGVATGDMEFRQTNGSHFASNHAFVTNFNTFAGIMKNTSLSVAGTVFAISSPTAQDQVVYLPPGQSAMIPLPSAGALALAGLGAAGLRRRR